MSRHLPLLSGVVFQSILSYQMKEVVRGGHREGWTRWSRRNEGLQVELQPLIAGLGYGYRRLSNLPRMGAATHAISILIPTLCSGCSPLRGTWNSVSDVLRTPATRRSARGKMIVHYHGLFRFPLQIRFSGSRVPVLQVLLGRSIPYRPSLSYNLRAKDRTAHRYVNRSGCKTRFI